MISVSPMLRAGSSRGIAGLGGRGAWGTAVAALLVLLGCGGRGEQTRVHEAGADHKVRIHLDSGPLGELDVTRDTGGRIVVAGYGFFPDGTRLTAALYDSSGQLLGRTQPTVDRALFRSLPIGPEAGGGWPAGRYQVELTALFVPGEQPPEVIRRIGPRSGLKGPGVTRTRQGQTAYSRRFVVQL